MREMIVLLSGHVGAGKTELSTRLAQRYGARHLKTRELIIQLSAKVEKNRDAMQREGESLDRRTKGRWVRDGLQQLIGKDGFAVKGTVVVDAVRIKNQISAVRDSYGHRVVHIHLTAPLEILERRYAKRESGKDFREFESYDQVLANPTEARVEQLRKIADVVIDSERCTVDDVVTRAACHAHLYPRDIQRLVDVLIGGQFGSEGKGQIAAHIASEYDVLVRVGGPNAGHTVRHLGDKAKFFHLPSGTVKGEMPILIGPGAVLDPRSLIKEIADYELEYDRISIDPQAMVIEPQDIDEEERTVKRRISSTAKGVGAATARKITGRGLKRLRLAKDVHLLKPYIRSTADELDKAFRCGHRVLLEGTQGTGLSIHHGLYPYVTSRDTTVAGCLAEAGISPGRVRKVIMVCRTYPIRVANPTPEGGTSGQLVGELEWDEIARRSGVPIEEILATEKTTSTNRGRRVGEFDWDLLRRAASLNAPTDIALTFVDYLHVKNKRAFRFAQLDKETVNFIEEVQRVAGAPVSLISTKFGWVIDRRNW